ncbi:hypothetical protein AB0K51_11855 [Kitasatospora sp. NPDC049285]|uniref:hypothetical protein n=1 Tax=Kitasatospora sp. NPDC049285 TaxID=3157096 RepID=UPI00341BE9BA
MIEPLLDTSVTAFERPGPAVVDEAPADPDRRPLPFTRFAVEMQARPTLDRTAFRIAEHLNAHRTELSEVAITFLGGEPRPTGADELDYAATMLRLAVPEGIAVRFSMTTNGVLLEDPRILAVLDRHEIDVTVSLDGSRPGPDRHRQYADGKGCHDAVMRAAAALRAHAPAARLRKLLCVIDLANDPLETYEALVAAGVPQLDFLLPLGDWETKPPGWTGEEGGAAYADWLIPVFDRWYDTVPAPTTVRLFAGIIALAVGGRSTTEAVGLGVFRSLAVDSHGSVDLVGALESGFADAPWSGLDVFGNSFDEARLHPDVDARQRGPAALSPTCLACPVRDVCGGGQYANRYRAGTGFRNPSVYCVDLRKLITHVRERVLADLDRLASGAEAGR